MGVMAPTNRERRAAKKRRRDERRGAGRGGTTTDPGLAAETLQAILRRAASDLADGDDAALSELRHVLAEHLARRRDRILDACDAVLVDVPADDTPLGAELARGGSASSWARRDGVGTEDAAVATVRLLALDLN